MAISIGERRRKICLKRGFKNAFSGNILFWNNYHIWQIVSDIFSYSLMNNKWTEQKNCISVKGIFYMPFLVMSSSWNFPARASPSSEGSELSRAELGTSIFELKPSWQYWQYVCQKIANSKVIFSPSFYLVRSF